MTNLYYLSILRNTYIAPAMTGNLNALLQNLNKIFQHYVRHIALYAVMTKTITDEHKNILSLMIKMINYIKSKSLKIKYLKMIYHEVSSRYETLVLHTEIR